MSHTITAKLNKPARKHQTDKGATFFVSLGEKNYNYATKTAEWTNYEAALFAKDSQIAFYESALIENAVIEVSGGGIIVDASNPSYPAKLVLQDAKLGFTHSPQGQAPQQQAPQSGYQQPTQAPQPQGGYQQAPQQQQNYQQQPQQNQQQPNSQGNNQNFQQPQ